MSSLAFRTVCSLLFFFLFSEQNLSLFKENQRVDLDRAVFYRRLALQSHGIGLIGHGIGGLTVVRVGKQSLTNFSNTFPAFLREEVCRWRSCHRSFLRNSLRPPVEYSFAAHHLRASEPLGCRTRSPTRPADKLPSEANCHPFPCRYVAGAY